MGLTAQGRETLIEWVVRLMVLFSCFPIHEWAHAFVANLLGDDTAKREGRLTLNPFAHLDLWGSILLVFMGFGWAKPVPVNPRKFKRPKLGMALSAGAGPFSNLLLACLLLAGYKLVVYNVNAPFWRFSRVPDMLAEILWIMLTTNLMLALFNLLPVPPLDGSRLFGAILPDRIYFGVMQYERIIIIAVFALMMTGVLSGPLNRLAVLLLRGMDRIVLPGHPLFFYG